MPDDDFPEAEPVEVAVGKQFKIGEVHAGPITMDWSTPDDDEPVA